jgi:hypothetical protein
MSKKELGLNGINCMGYIRSLLKSYWYKCESKNNITIKGNAIDFRAPVLTAITFILIKWHQ